MSQFEVIRAWKDASYRESLSAEELARLPEHPASSIELTDAELNQAEGGTWGTLTGISPAFDTWFTSCLTACMPPCGPIYE